MKKNVQVRTEKGVTTLRSSIFIKASKQEVWDVLKNPGEIEKFHPLIKKSYCSSDKTSGLDTKRVCELIPMGQMQEEITAWNEGESFTAEVVGGKMLPPYRFMKGMLELKEQHEGTQVTFTFTYQLKFGVLGHIMNVLMIRPQFKDAPVKYVYGLKQYVEKRV